MHCVLIILTINYITHFFLFVSFFCCIWREENIAFGLVIDVHCFPIKHSLAGQSVTNGILLNLLTGEGTCQRGTSQTLLLFFF